jgi:hypothetical protein
MFIPYKSKIKKTTTNHLETEILIESEFTIRT